MTLSQYQAEITASVLQEYGDAFVFPDSFEHDTEMLFTCHVPLEDAIKSTKDNLEETTARPRGWDYV